MNETLFDYESVYESINAEKDSDMTEEETDGNLMRIHQYLKNNCVRTAR